jgi:hypothetical protein
MAWPRRWRRAGASLAAASVQQAPRPADQRPAAVRLAAPASCRPGPAQVVRWVIITTAAPQAVGLPEFRAPSSARSPASSRLALGSSSTSRRGWPYSARASATRWRWPPDSRVPATHRACQVPGADSTNQALQTHQFDGLATAAAGLPRETGNVLTHRPFNQVHVLRQVTDVRAQFVLVPAEDIGAVQADLALQAGHKPTSSRARRGFARGRRDRPLPASHPVPAQTACR